MPTSHREATATAPVLDSTTNPFSFGLLSMVTKWNLVMQKIP